MPEYFDRYINLIEDIELSEAFDQSIARIDALDVERLTRLDGYRYAADKWTAKEIIQHVIDWERIFCYRALLLARHEGSPLPGIEESTLANGMNANDLTIPELLGDLGLPGSRPDRSSRPLMKRCCKPSARSGYTKCPFSRSASFHSATKHTISRSLRNATYGHSRLAYE